MYRAEVPELQKKIPKHISQYQFVKELYKKLNKQTGIEEKISTKTNKA